MLTAVRHNESRQTGERLVGSDKKTAIVERFDLVVFDVMAPAFLPILHRQAVTSRIVLAWPDQERTAWILVDQQQLARFLTRHILKEPTAKNAMTRLIATLWPSQEKNSKTNAHSSLSTDRSTATKFHGIKPSCRVVKCSTLHQSGSESSSTSIRSPLTKLTSVLSRAV